MSDQRKDEYGIWNRPFATPMMKEAYCWTTNLIEDGHTGGVIYAPTRTGKTKTIRLLCEEVRSFPGPHGHVISETEWVVAPDRLVMSEGGFWDWMLLSFNHPQAGKGSPNIKRHCVCEYVKGLARKAPTGRLVLFIDEAQLLVQPELGWLADLFNSLDKDGFELIVILIGTYHLGDWKEKLGGTRQEHIKARFFLNEYRLRGLTTKEDFRRCMRRFDVDRVGPPGSSETITQHYQRSWYGSGGRLENRSVELFSAFKAVSGERKTFEVPMAYFIRAVRRILNYAEYDSSMPKFKAIVRKTGFN